jgi:hypothetical protein
MVGDRTLQAQEVLARTLTEGARLLEVDVIFAAEFGGELKVFRQVEGDAASCGWRDGGAPTADGGTTVELSDGRPWGTLWCLSRESDDWLADRDAGLMAKLARMVVRELELDGLA